MKHVSDIQWHKPVIYRETFFAAAIDKTCFEITVTPLHNSHRVVPEA